MGGAKIGGTKWSTTSAGLDKPDKRRTHRHTLALDTDVHFHEPAVKGMFRCHTGNIGLNGVFLPSENMPITSKTDVELVFHANSRTQASRYSINARVIRNAADGAALVFCPENEQQIQGLRRFLLKAKVANPQ